MIQNTQKRLFTKIPVCVYAETSSFALSKLFIIKSLITILSSLSLMQLFFCHKSPWQIMTPPCLHFLQPLLCTEHHFGWWPQAFKPSTFIFSASLSCFLWLSFLFSPDHTSTSPLVGVFHLVPTFPTDHTVTVANERGLRADPQSRACP